MSARRLFSLGCAGLGLSLLACGQPDPGGGPAAAPTASDRARDTDEAPQPRLGPDEIRVALLVLPGDAEVEVKGASVRRRNGVIHLAGKVHDKVAVRVSKGLLSMEKEVTLELGHPEPGVLDLDKDATPAPAFGSPQTAGSSPAAAAPPADALLPDEFE